MPLRTRPPWIGVSERYGDAPDGGAVWRGEWGGIVTDLAQRIRDEFPGTPDEEIPGLIRMLRLNRPDDQLRIERNYYRTLAMERAEEVIIWRRRAEGPQAPSVADVLQDLQTKVSAAASNYAREVAALPRKIEPSLPSRSEHRAWSTVGPGCDPPAARPTPPQVENLPALELRRVRAELGFSQAVMACRLRIPVAKLSLYEKGAPVPPEILKLALEQVSP